MSQLLSDVIALGCGSLEQEEQFLCREAARNGHTGGLLTVGEIGFCPYVFVRAILPNYRATHAFAREGRRVCVLSVKHERKNYFLVLDHWREEPVEVLQEAVERVSDEKGEACLVVLSASRPGETNERQRRVETLEGVGEKVVDRRFPVTAASGEALEFWVAAWRAPGRSRAGAGP